MPTIATKTSIFPIFSSQLSSLNDQLCFFLFAGHELIIKTENFSREVDDKFTVDLFARNPYSSKINVELKDLRNFQRKNATFTFGAYFSRSYEVAATYLEDSIEFLKYINGLSFKKDEKKPPEDNFTKAIQTFKYIMLPPEIIKTLTYMRLRRNHSIHISNKISNKLNSIISNEGTKLNSFWRRRANLNALDFTSSAINDFGEKETIELIKLVRIILTELDCYIASNLNVNNIIEMLFKEKIDRSIRLNRLRINEISRKIVKLCDMNFGMSVKIDDVRQIVSQLI